MERGPLARGDGGAQTDSGSTDAGRDAQPDAHTMGDAAMTPDASGSDASEDDAGTIDAGDAGDAGGGTCVLDEDCATRPCHEANCALGLCIYTPQPFGLATDVAQPPNDCTAVYCDGSGHLINIGDALDPPLEDGDFCTLEACSNMMPVHIGLPDGTQLPPEQQDAGDCKVKRCLNGMTAEINDDLDRPMSSACEDGTCNGGVPGVQSRSPGLSCGAELICNDQGNCVSCLGQSASCDEDWECCGGDCVGGQCGAGCTAGHADCDGMDQNGCETPINTVTNCGACNTACVLPNASESCATGACVITTCDANFANCNGVASDGCEQSLRTLTSCGGCGVVCARNNANATCATGTCSFSTCRANWANCDGNNLNGCETPTNTLTNCGGCGVTCGFANATANCSAGSCERVSCNAGFDDCDANPNNGCEASLTSLSHCGGCNILCSGPDNRALSCSTGSCVVGACSTGFQDCDGDANNGCEWNVSNGACPCVGNDDTDGDGLSNCDEIEDGDNFTDPDIFNGARVVHYPLCASGFPITTVSCNDYDTLEEVIECTDKTPRQALDQYAGWDFNDPSGATNAINSAGFGFQPNWSGTNTSFQLDAQAFINIAQAGQHCFRINGGSGGSCGSLYLATTSADDFCGWSSLNSNTAPVVQHGDNAVCLQLSPGVYPIRWHLDRNTGAQGDFHLDHCFGGNTTCSPVNALPNRMLRPTWTGTCASPAADCTLSVFNGRDYWVCNTALSWSAARSACQAIGMDLVAINSSGENTFLTNAIDTDSWTALSDSLSESTWMWMTTYSPVWTGGSNGTQVPGAYVNWGNNEPNGDSTRNCAELMTNGRWNDTTCGTPQAFVCEEQ